MTEIRCVVCGSPDVTAYNPFCKPCEALIQGKSVNEEKLDELHTALLPQ